VIAGEARDGEVVLSVEDEGTGVPDAERERIFERFYQVDQSTTRSVSGAGLGLYICRKLADEIGGRVWLERSDARGSVFTLAIPSRKAAGERLSHA